MSLRESAFNIVEQVARTFDGVRRRQADYRMTFSTPHGQRVLRDLMIFCRSLETAYHPEQRKTDVLIGRQETSFRILDHLNLSTDQLYKLLGGQDIKPEDM